MSVFERLGEDALDMVAMKRGIDLAASDRARVLEQMRQLPPHPEVVEALHTLRGADLRLATLTNSPPAVLKDQLTNAGLIDLFECTLSVDSTRRFKPAPETYHYAAEKLGVDVRDLRLVAAHDWTSPVPCARAAPVHSLPGRVWSWGGCKRAPISSAWILAM